MQKQMKKSMEPGDRWWHIVPLTLDPMELRVSEK